MDGQKSTSLSFSFHERIFEWPWKQSIIRCREREREREREKGNLMLVCCPWQRSKGEFVTGSLL
jgi:hypothetical protein